MKLARLSPLWIEIAVPASGVRAIRPGARVDVDGYDTPGRVVLVSETADAVTQTVLVPAPKCRTPASCVRDKPRRREFGLSFARRGRLGGPVQRPYSAGRGHPPCSSRSRAAFGLVPVTLLAEDQDHVVVSGAISDSDTVAISGVSALRGILQGLGAGGVMLERVVEFALSQRLFVILGVLLLIGGRRRRLAHLADRCVSRRLAGPGESHHASAGLTPEELEQRITAPIELALRGIPNKKILRSTPKYALAE